MRKILTSTVLMVFCLSMGAVSAQDTSQINSFRKMQKQLDRVSAIRKKQEQIQKIKAQSQVYGKLLNQIQAQEKGLDEVIRVQKIKILKQQIRKAEEALLKLEEIKAEQEKLAEEKAKKEEAESDEPGEI